MLRLNLFPLIIKSLNLCLVLVALLCLIFSYLHNLSGYKLGFQVVYQDTGLRVLKNNPDMPVLAVDDIITAFNGQKVADFLTSKENTKIRLTNPPPQRLNKLYQWPLPTEVEMFLVNTSEPILTILKADSKQMLELDLRENAVSKSQLLRLHIQFLIALVYCACSCILIFLRPGQLLTLTFNCYFSFSAVYSLLDSVLPFYRDDIFIVIGLLCTTLPPIGKLYFCIAAFPFGKVMDKNKLALFLPASIAIFLLNFVYFFLYFFVTLPVFVLQIINPLRILVFLLAMGFSDLYIVLRFFKARDQEWQRLQVVCFTWLIVVVPPFIIFVLQSFDFYPQILITYLNFFWFLSVFLPVAYLYAILKHQAFYADLEVRNILAYALLTILLSFSYWILTTATSYFLHNLLNLSSLDAELPIFLGLLFTFSKFKDIILTTLDRVFYRDRLNYAGLVTGWTKELAFTNITLTNLVIKVISSLGDDFRYREIGLFLIEDANRLSQNTVALSLSEIEEIEENDNAENNNFKAFLIKNSATNLNSISSTFDQNNRSGLVGKLLDLNNLFQKNISVESFSIPHSSLPYTHQFQQIEISGQTIPQILSLNNQIFYPFAKDCIVMGGLLLGEKLSGEVPKVEERTALETLTYQIALALDRTVKVQIEQSQKQTMQAFILEQDSLSDRQSQRLASEVHDSVIQDIIVIKTRLKRFIRQAEEIPVSLLEGCYDLADTAEKHLRETIGQLRPKSFEFGLIVALKELMLGYMNKNEDISFVFDSLLKDEAEEAINAFDEESLRHIYRLVQEAVNNAVKHSQATTISVQLHLETIASKKIEGQNDLILQISDNGTGFIADDLAPSNLLAKGHFGIFFMQERVRLLNGNLSFKNNSEGGGLVCIRVPFISSSLKKDILCRA